MARNAILPILLIATFSTLASVSAGENNVVESITLQQAIEKTISNNPRLKASTYQVDIADAGIMKAGSGYLPKVELREIYQKTTNPMWAFGHKLNQESIAAADFSPDRLNNPDPIDNWGTTLTVTQPIYTGGKVSAYSAQARLNKEAAQKEMERTRQEVIFETTMAYYGVALAEANLEAAKEVLATAEANMEMARSLLKAGVVVESDFLSARVNWSEAMEEDIKAANAVTLSNARLAGIMGMDIETLYKPADRLLDGTDRIGDNFSHLNAMGREIEPADERPDYAVMHYRVEMLEKEVEAAKASNMPTVGLVADYEIDGNAPVSSDGNNWTVMGVLRWNLFNGYENTARINEARAESKKVKELTREMESGIRIEALSARLELKAARDRVFVARESVKQAHESHRIVRNRYNEGMTTMVDLLNSGTALKKAKLNLTQALYDYRVGEARLKLALGILK